MIIWQLSSIFDDEINVLALLYSILLLGSWEIAVVVISNSLKKEKLTLHGVRKGSSSLD